MRRSIAVHLDEEATPLGTLRYDQQGSRESAAFEYDASWLKAADGFSIEPGLPLVTGPQFHRKSGDGSVFHNAIADTEPDGWGRRVIQRDHAKRRQEARRAGNVAETRPLNAMDYLLAVDDMSRIGALQLKDEEGRYQRAAEEGRRTTPPLIEIGQLLAATHAVETNTETATDLAYLRGRGTSLGGLRPKCSVVDDDGRLAIGKFPSVADDRSVTKGEVLAMILARKAGVEAAETRLIDSDGAPVALIRRFDRTPNGNRLMYVSAATMIGAESGDAGEHSYTELVDMLRRHGSQPAADIEELWRRIAFSILITNVDDHLHNHGFIHVDRGQWRLAPAFDINPFPERVRDLKTWISEETGPEAKIDALMSVIAYFRIKTDRAKTILAEVERAVSTWREEGRALGMTHQELDSFADAFEHRERQAAQRALQ
ncbi:type II toxin-antitoxin system HipA family toxin [Mesorhizobium sp. B283B1A]|uniref:type II toxin-antitoxin system HipA family toxin n=1 Tax=Mesorhizobium TaxID=68287 RepID=UPI001CD0C511|nr:MULTISPECIES: type II toxin-antitoxin system HipA family toxin [Mesorhizobium]MCA0049300.1 type II toxin-antitoxin system HipA family toxin [Mesorhizobium sp. B283B1A]UQS64450.1 type II toxin-antitoxin system HipA family toxin [Mesorhizobium opportunistum]